MLHGSAPPPNRSAARLRSKEADEMVVEEQDYYYSSSDSDDEDVSRYVFLARQPAPEGRHPEEDDRNASFANDDDDGGDGDGTAGGEESKGGVWKRKKMPLLEIVDDDAPPPTKKARVELIMASPLAAQTPPSGSESNLASPPLAGESGSEGSHEKAAHEHRAPREQGEAKSATKKQRGACGKRSRSSGCDVDGDRDAHRHAVAAAAAASASSGGRFPCSLCDRCFDSHQALGGHVLGHRKRAKIDIAAGAILDVDDDKVHGNGNGGVGEPVFAGSHDDADGNGFDSKCSNSIAVPGHGFTDGNSRSDGKMDIGTASPNRKVVVAGTCHEGANGNGNGDGCRTRYKCKVCGTECLTGRALGGHMGKHRKRPPVGGGGEEDRSPSPATDDDRQTFGAAVRRRD